MRVFKIALFACLLLVVTQTTYAGGIEFTHGTWAEVKAKAEKENKIIFIDAFTDWCGPCKWMAANSFPDEEVGSFFNEKFINVKIDMEKGEGPEIAKIYGVNAYPTLLWVDVSGELIYKMVGALDAKTLLKEGQTAVSADNPQVKLKKTWDAGNRERNFLADYLLLLSDASLPLEDVFNAYQEQVKPEDLMEDKFWQVFLRIYRRIDTPEFEYFKNNHAAFVAKFGEEPVNWKLENNYSMAARGAVLDQDKEKLDQIRAEMKNSGIQALEAPADQALLMWFNGTEDWASYWPASIAYSHEHKWESWQDLNGIAWDFYENCDNKKLLKEALTIAKRSIELDENYYNLDTYAMLFKKIGKKKDAIKWCEKAILVAKEKGDDFSATEEELKELR